MNIDVKNAFDKVTTVCDSLVHKVSNAESFHKIFRRIFLISYAVFLQPAN